MSERYDRELADARIFDLLNTLANLYAYATERGDTAEQMRVGALVDALHEFTKGDKEAK